MHRIDKKRTSRYISFILSACMMMSSAPANLVYAQEYENTAQVVENAEETDYDESVQMSGSNTEEYTEDIYTDSGDEEPADDAVSAKDDKNDGFNSAYDSKEIIPETSDDGSFTSDDVQDISDAVIEDMQDSDIISEDISGVESISADDIGFPDDYEEDVFESHAISENKTSSTLSGNEVCLDDYWISEGYATIIDDDYPHNFSNLEEKASGTMNCGTSWVLYTDGTMVIDITSESTGSKIDTRYVGDSGMVNEEWWDYATTEVKSLWFISSDNTSVDFPEAPQSADYDSFSRIAAERIHFDKNYGHTTYTMFQGNNTLKFIQYSHNFRPRYNCFLGCPLEGIVTIPLTDSPWPVFGGLSSPNTTITGINFDLSYSIDYAPIMGQIVTNSTNVSSFYVTDIEEKGEMGYQLMNSTTMYQGSDDVYMYINTSSDTLNITNLASNRPILHVEVSNPELIKTIKKCSISEMVTLNLSDMVNLERVCPNAFYGSSNITNWGFDEDKYIDFTRFTKLKRIGKAAFGIRMNPIVYDSMSYYARKYSSDLNATQGKDDTYIRTGSDYFYDRKITDGAYVAGNNITHEDVYNENEYWCGLCPNIDTVIFPDYGEIDDEEELDIYYSTSRNSRCKFIIDECAFAGCNIKNIDFSRCHGYYIGEYAFLYCPIENDIIFPDDFVGFGYTENTSRCYVFNEFRGRNVSLPATAVNGGYYGIFNAIFKQSSNSNDNVSNYPEFDSMTYTKGSRYGIHPDNYGIVNCREMIMFPAKGETGGSVQFGDGITSIDYGIGGSVKSYTFPNDGNLKRISSFNNGGSGYYLFPFKGIKYNDIMIPDSVEELGGFLFGMGDWYNDSNIAYAPDHFNIPLSLKKMDESCFQFSPLTSYDFSGCDSLTEFPDSCFSLSHLTTLKYPSGLKKIGGGCFSYCRKFADKFTLPDGIEYIGNNAYSQCPLLTDSVIMPETISVLGTGIFDGCAGLSDTIKFPDNDLSKPNGDPITNIADLPSVKDCSFTTVYVPVSALSKNDDFYNTFPVTMEELILTKGRSGEMYDSTNDNDDVFTHLFSSIPEGGTIRILDGVKNIGDYCFKNANVSKLTISSNTLTKIGDGAFENCTKLSGSLVIPDNLQYVGNNAFSNTSYESVSIPVTALPADGGIRRIFRGCNDIRSFIFTKGCDNEYYGRSEGEWPDLDYADYWEYAPYFADSDNYVIIEKGVKNIGKYAFSNAAGLANLSMPVDIDIDMTSFDTDNVIANIILTEGTNTNDILDSTYDGEHDGYLRFPWNKSSLNNVNVDLSYLNGINRIGNYAFYESSNSYVKLPRTVAEIGDYAFYKNLSPALSLFDMRSFQKVGERSFYECTTLPAVVDLSDAASIGTESYYNCPNIDGIYISTKLVHDDLGNEYHGEIGYEVHNGYAYYTGEPTNGGAHVTVSDNSATVYYGLKWREVNDTKVPSFTEIGSHKVRFKIVKNGETKAKGTLIVNITEYKEVKSKIPFSVINGISEYTNEPTDGGAKVIIENPEEYTNLKIRYCETEGEYDLSSIPKYNQVGNHCVYFRITANGYEDTYGTVLVLIGSKEGVINVSDDEIYLYNREDASSFDISVWSSDGIVKIGNYDDSYVSVSINKTTSATEADPAILTVKAKGYSVGDDNRRKYGDTKITLIKDYGDEFAATSVNILVHVVDSSGQMVAGPTFNSDVIASCHDFTHGITTIFEQPIKVVFAVENIRGNKGYILYNGETTEVPAEDEVLNLSTGTDLDYYGFRHGDTYFVVGRGKKVKLNADSKNMFMHFRMSGIDFNDSADFSEIKDISGMFSSCDLFDMSGLQGFDTSHAENMSAMFSGFRSDNYDLSFMNTENCKDMSYMFANTAWNDYGLSSFDTANVVNMEAMFAEVSSNNIISLNSFDTSKAENMKFMFTGCEVPKIDISSFDTSNVKNMDYMFASQYSDIIYPADGLNITSAETMTGMYMARDEEDIDLSVLFGETVYAPALKDCSNMFTGCRDLKSINLEGFKAPVLETIEGMFSYCTSLESLVFDLEGYDVDIDYTCSNCPSLKYLDMSCIHNGDLKFEGSNVFGVSTNSGRFIRSVRKLEDYAMNDRGNNKPHYHSYYSDMENYKYIVENLKYSDEYVTEFVNPSNTTYGLKAKKEKGISVKTPVYQFSFGNEFSNNGNGYKYITLPNPRSNLSYFANNTMKYTGFIKMSEFAPINLEVFRTPKFSSIYNSLRGHSNYLIDCLPYTMQDEEGNEYREIPHDNMSIALYKVDEYFDVSQGNEKGFNDQNGSFISMSRVNYMDRDFKTGLVYYVYDDFQNIYIKGSAIDNVSDVTDAKLMYTDFSNYGPWNHYNGMINSLGLTLTVTNITQIYQEGTEVDTSSDTTKMEDVGFQIDLSKYNTTYAYNRESMPDWAYFVQSWKPENLIFNAQMNGLKMEDYFTDMDTLKNIEFGSECDLSDVQNMVGCFAGCHDVEMIDLTNINSSDLSDNIHLDYMFAGCQSLDDIYVDDPDIWHAKASSEPFTFHMNRAYADENANSEAYTLQTALYSYGLVGLGEGPLGYQYRSSDVYGLDKSGLWFSYTNYDDSNGYDIKANSITYINAQGSKAASTNIFTGTKMSIDAREFSRNTFDGNDYYPDDIYGFSKYAIINGTIPDCTNFSPYDYTDADKRSTWETAYGRKSYYDVKRWVHYYKVYKDNNECLKDVADGGFLKIK